LEFEARLKFHCAATFFHSIDIFHRQDISLTLFDKFLENQEDLRSLSTIEQNLILDEVGLFEYSNIYQEDSNVQGGTFGRRDVSVTSMYSYLL
jgi:hypothetical protein